MRLISFSLTTRQFLAGQKDVTRRLGWFHTKRGDKLCAVEKSQGLRKGEKIKRLAVIEVVGIRREKLNAITADDVVREGFPTMTVAEFVRFFCKSMNCKPWEEVARIEFRRIP